MRPTFPKRPQKSYWAMPIIIGCLLLQSGCSTGEPTPPSQAVSQQTPPRTVVSPGKCPHSPEIKNAPQLYYTMVNPLQKNAQNLESGRTLYHKKARPIPCVNCHGKKGDGKGPFGLHLDPPPVAFACVDMKAVTDGQLLWVIENGSGEFHLASKHSAKKIQRPGRRKRFTAMRAHKDHLTRTEMWQLILYLRTFAADRPEKPRM